MKKTGKRNIFQFILPAFAAGALIASATLPTSVKAEGADPTVLPVYDITIGDSTVTSALKENIITTRAESDDAFDINNIDLQKSTIDVTGLDYSKSGLQTATVKATIVNTDSSTDTVGYSFVENVAVNVMFNAAPQLTLRNEEVTINNGDSFNAESYIAYINDDSNILPALQVNTNIDTAVDGDYTAEYVAVDKQGNYTTKTLTVHVRTPQEVLDAQAAAEAEAQAQAQAEAEAQARAEAEAQAQAAAAAAQSVEYAGTGAIAGSGANPYSGGFSNCTAGAWLLEASMGVYLPNFGNATGWISSAQSYGYSTGSTPAVGAVAVYSHHVAVVTGVNADGSVNIAEGGFNGHYNERTVSAWGTGTQSLRGYIYTN